MLKPVLTSFIIVMFCLIAGSCVVYGKQEIINNSVEAPLKDQSNPVKGNCNEVQAVADIMFGEGENQPLYAKKDLGYFLISEAKKNNRSLCRELNYRMPGGHLKYTSMHSNLKIRKKNRKESYKNISAIAKEFWEKDRNNYKKIEKYNHYITLDLAYRNPPKWFKYYIVEYYISGDHVFVNLDFENKKETRISGKYLNNYKSLVKEIKNRKNQ